MSQPVPHRSLGVFSLTCLGLNSVIGSGIFLSPGLIAKFLGPWAPLGFFLGGLLALPIGLCFAEAARRETETGGAYLYARRAFGPEVGFLVGWVIWLSGLIGGATVAVGFGEFLGQVAGLPGRENAIACAVLIVLAAINLSGTRRGAWSNNLLATAKLIPLVLFVLWALVQVGPHRMLFPPTPDSWSYEPWSGAMIRPWTLALVPGLLQILYAFSGFEEVPLPAGEVQEPDRTVPRALMGVLATGTVFYCLIQGGVSGLGLAGDPAPLSSATRDVPFLGPAITCAGVLCLLSVNASIAFTTPRSLWALASGGWLPSWLCHLHPRFQSPSRCILINLVLGLSLTASGTFQQLVQMSVLASLVQFLATCLACWKGRGYSLRPSAPTLATAVCLLLLVNCSWDSLKGLGEALLLGWILSRGYRWRRGAPSLSPEVRPPSP